MKRSFKGLRTCVFFSGVFACALSGTVGQAETATPQVAKAAAKPSIKEATVKGKFIALTEKGKDRKITIDRQGKKFMISLSPSAKVMNKSKVVTFADIKKNQSIQLFYHGKGKDALVSKILLEQQAPNAPAPAKKTTPQPAK